MESISSNQCHHNRRRQKPNYNPFLSSSPLDSADPSGVTSDDNSPLNETIRSFSDFLIPSQSDEIDNTENQRNHQDNDDNGDSGAFSISTDTSASSSKKSSINPQNNSNNRTKTANNNSSIPSDLSSTEDDECELKCCEGRKRGQLDSASTEAFGTFPSNATTAWAPVPDRLKPSGMTTTNPFLLQDPSPSSALLRQKCASCRHGVLIGKTNPIDTAEFPGSNNLTHNETIIMPSAQFSNKNSNNPFLIHDFAPNNTTNSWNAMSGLNSSISVHSFHPESGNVPDLPAWLPESRSTMQKRCPENDSLRQNHRRQFPDDNQKSTNSEARFTNRVSRSFPSDTRDSNWDPNLSNLDYYHSTIDSNKATEILRDRSAGSFLLRPSCHPQSPAYCTLSVVKRSRGSSCGGGLVNHIRIFQSDGPAIIFDGPATRIRSSGGFYIQGKSDEYPRLYSTIAALVADAVRYGIEYKRYGSYMAPAAAETLNNHFSTMHPAGVDVGDDGLDRLVLTSPVSRSSACPTTFVVADERKLLGRDRTTSGGPKFNYYGDASGQTKNSCSTSSFRRKDGFQEQCSWVAF